MVSIYITGCCLLLAVVVTPSQGGLFQWSKKSEPDIPVGLVKGDVEATPTPKPQEEKKTKNQAVGDPNTNAITASSDKKTSSPPKPKKKPSTPEKKDANKVSANGATATAAATGVAATGAAAATGVAATGAAAATGVAATGAATGSLTVAEAKKENQKKMKEVEGMKKKVGELKKDLKNDLKNNDESLDELVEDLMDISKKRFKVRFALIIYAIINFILWVAQYAGTFITPPVGKALFFLDMVAKNAVRKPLNDYYADFQTANAEAVAKYMTKHRDEFKHVRVGKRITVKTPKGTFSFKVTKKNPGEPLKPDDLHIVDKNPVKVLGAVMGMKKR